MRAYFERAAHTFLRAIMCIIYICVHVCLVRIDFFFFFDLYSTKAISSLRGICFFFCALIYTRAVRVLLFGGVKNARALTRVYAVRRYVILFKGSAVALRDNRKLFFKLNANLETRCFCIKIYQHMYIIGLLKTAQRILYRTLRDEPNLGMPQCE